MIFQSSEIQGKRIKVADDDDANHEAVCHKFWKNAPEDILVEIFIRLPDSRSAIRTAAVCHKWQSLISHNPQFIPRQQQRYPLHSAIFFRKAEQTTLFNGPQCFQPICKLIFSKELKFCSRRNFLDFLPCSPMVIRASCNDLLLVSTGSCVIADLYVCNPITKQFVHLPVRETFFGAPKIPGFALVSMPNSQFKVVEVPRPRHLDYIRHDSDSDFESESDSLLIEPMRQRIFIFCSESRKWRMGSFLYRPPKIQHNVLSLDVVRCNGVLYWLETQSHVERIMYWDLSSWCGGVIDLPGSFPKIAVQIGTVRESGGVEELRLLRLHHKGKGLFIDLKVWKLNYDKDKKYIWVLVHHKEKLKVPKMNYKEERFAGPFFHPTNGDLVFLVWGIKVFRYKLDCSIRTCTKISTLKEPLVMRTDDLLPCFDRLLPFPVVQPLWPTLLPNL